MRVHLSSPHIVWSWFRQTPGGDGVWGGLTYDCNPVENDADWLVVYDEPMPGLTTRVPWHRRILFVSEPPGIKSYSRAYLNQFGMVVSPFPIVGYRGNLVLQQPALPWHYGVDMQSENRFQRVLGWNELAAGKEKSKTLSVICSNKSMIPHHRLRLAFVERLKQRLGERADVFGRGFRDIADKAEAIAPYRYHVVLENNVVDHFWTEKLADAWLGDAYPIFAGCGNVGRYFDTASVAQIDISDPDRAIDRIEDIISSEAWELNRESIRENRRRLMAEHNLFAVVARLAGEADRTAKAASRLARPAAIQPSHQIGLANTCRRLGQFAQRLPVRLLGRVIPKRTRDRWKQNVRRMSSLLTRGKP